MDISRRTTLTFAGLTVCALVLPLIIFPSMFGLDLTRASWVNAALELVWFGFILFLLNRRASLAQLLSAAAVTLLYRWGLGVLFGLIISAMYGMNLRISLDLGVFSYLPGLLVQAALAPFAVTGFFGRLERPVTRRVPRSSQHENDEAEADRPALQRESLAGREQTESPRPAHFESPKPIRERQAAEDRQPVWQSPKLPSQESQRDHSTPAGESNGFDKAARYIGEDGAVHFSAVIDREGLLLGQFARREWLPEDWAPLALSMLESNRVLGKRTGWGEPERVDLHFEDTRVSVVADERTVLVVFAERHQGDVLNIRINQAYDMIRKYMADRYGHLAAVKAETKYV